jgi:protein TonB
MHAIVLAALIVIPLIFFDVLPDMELLTFVFADPGPPVPPPQPPPPGTLMSAAVRPTHIEHIEFTGPEKIPNGIPAPGNDEPPIVDLSLPASVNPRGIQPDAIGLQAEALALLRAVAPPVPEPPPPPVRKSSVPVGGKVLESRLINRVVPEYPALARQARVSGTVILQVNVDEEGNIFDVRILSGHPLLEEAAVRAVRQWKYSPTLLNGEPVAVVATVTVVFNLK